MFTDTVLSSNQRSGLARAARAISLFGLFAALALTFGADGAQAQFWSSSRLLLPYFEVDMQRLDGPTTFVALVNTSDETITVHAEVYSNWGIEIFETTFEIEANAGYTANLADWLRLGGIPKRCWRSPSGAARIYCCRRSMAWGCQRASMCAGWWKPASCPGSTPASPIARPASGRLVRAWPKPRWSVSCRRWRHLPPVIDQVLFLFIRVPSISAVPPALGGCPRIGIVARKSGSEAKLA